MRCPLLRELSVAVAVSVLLTALGLREMLRKHEAAPVAPKATIAAVVAPVTPPPPPPAAEPSSAVPTLVEVASTNVDRRVKALAREMGKMWTRNPDELVGVIDEAYRDAAESSPSVTLLLAIAHAETNGKILDVSEAGAVGLAQATPVAAVQEGFSGKLFVTTDYLVASRAYIMKKALGDADMIASLVVARDDEKSRSRAKRLLKAAMQLRREGVDELEMLAPFASKKYFATIEKADRHNGAVLRELETILQKGSKAQVKAFRDRTRIEYRALKKIQMDGWKKYQLELAAKRDRMLEREFGQSATFVKKERPYEAGEFLGRNLDVRFSPRHMASFLVKHLERKGIEAKSLAGKGDDVEAMTAALYNGGSHNVKRMLAGLIASLPETQNYMKKVPATRRRLDATIAAAESAAPGKTGLAK